MQYVYGYTITVEGESKETVLAMFSETEKKKHENQVDKMNEIEKKLSVPGCKAKTYYWLRAV